ncbi:MAG: FkbM family methyltransferase [Alphaproteobacteria bacterium HGW-Alphaproteobacteria-5]|nr:MAG: FkbM family methyltransferase [Alphaproteobacteria bacterium HGW-Alphaproteobacteria-5]
MSFFDDLFSTLPQIADRHSPHDPLCRLLRRGVSEEVAEAFHSGGDEAHEFGPFGALTFPYFEMGAINSLHLFGLDELILFAFYNANRGRYARVVDFGANIGLHSIVLSRCGFEVRSFEPDLVHVERFNLNTRLNGVAPELHRAAVSLKDGKTEFVRVLGNTTGSHIKGAKSDPYGELETIEVTLEAAAPHLAWADLAKIDIEGHEAELLTGLSPAIWKSTDAILEVGTAENAAAIFRHLHGSGVHLFAQKIGWREVASLDDMPVSHRDGSLFLTGKPVMNWDA